MDITVLTDLYPSHPVIESLQKELVVPGGNPILLEGLSGSAPALVVAGVYKSSVSTHLTILKDKEEAAYFYNDLVSLCGDENIFFFPSSFRRSVVHEKTDPGNIILRSSMLNHLGSGKRKCIVVTYPEALVEKVLTKTDLSNNTMRVKNGETLSREFLEEVLQEYMFTRVDFVNEPGQYSVRGSLVDLFSFSSDKPVRIDFFGDTIESIRYFDPDTQLSSGTIQSFSILPDLLSITGQSSVVPLLDFIPPSSYIWLDNPELVFGQMDAIFSVALSRESSGSLPVPGDSLINGSKFSQLLAPFRLIEMGGNGYFRPFTSLKFNTEPQPPFHKNFDLVIAANKRNRERGYSSIIVSESEIQTKRLIEIFKEIGPDVSFNYVQASLHRGFTDHDIKTSILTDHQIFDRYHKFKIRGSFAKKESVALKEITSLNPGDYIVHIDHGIGRFGGLEKIEVNGRMQEAIKLVYRDNDILYVGIHSLHRISKYKGRDTEEPRIHKLGSGAWQKLKQETKRKVKDIARDLISLYAKRMTLPGTAYSPDSYLQHELEASFIYEDTPDQVSATESVKKDMEAGHPMDRLICGDVGFGKTEVAVRAAFKAATDGKQTAVLVPTTILALQHFKTFQSRLEGFPVSVDYISRHRKPADQKNILASLSEGKTDIIIGTHKLVGSDVKFKDLGLLIIDEEQRFGVAVKEKIKRLKANVDTLTLSATPIPRTLQFSLMGARDLSIINTPPPNRVPVATELHGFNEDIVREGIEYEVNRNGQVFFIHNRVETIKAMQGSIERICPGVRAAVVHGKMSGEAIESIMTGFIQGDYDVLIATTIIESGLDIPNANTIFINDAHHFGLSELHQLRGRVGRSNRKAFCYLLTPPLNALTHDARRRVLAIEEFSGLGSGFNIAMQDLDIRGAGNLLGGEQSGFIADIGFEAYQRILSEAAFELREEQGLKEPVPTNENAVEEKSSQGELHGDGLKLAREVWSSDIQIDTDLEVMFPDDYISNIPERLRLYRELNEIKDEATLAQFEGKLTDRFGKVPPRASALMGIVRLKWAAAKLGMEKITLKNSLMLITFNSDPKSSFYQSPRFSLLMNYVNRRQKRMKMRQNEKKLTLIINDIQSVTAATAILQEMTRETDS